MLVLKDGTTVADYATHMAARLRTLGCSDAYVQEAEAGLLAHTVRGPDAVLGTTWLTPEEAQADPVLAHKVDPEDQKKRHSWI